MDEKELLSFSFMVNNGKATGDDFKLLNTKLLKWDHVDVFPILDLLRVLVRDDEVSDYYYDEIDNFNIIDEVLAIGFGENTSDTLKIMGLRFLTNVFPKKLMSIVVKRAQEILKIISICKQSTNKNIRDIYIKFLLK
jgi:hypothetical protein